MDRYWMANVSATAPDVTGGTKGYPQDGDVGAGLAATRPGAAWFWAVTAEILALISAGGGTPDHTVLTQMATAVSAIAGNAAAAAQAAAITAATGLAAAARSNAVADIVAMFTGANQSIGANGYQVFPGGRIEQECDVAVTGAAHTTVTVTYPMAFTNSSKVPLVSIVDPSESAVAGNFLGLSVLSHSNSGCVVALDANGGGGRDVVLHVEVVGR